MYVEQFKSKISNMNILSLYPIKRVEMKKLATLVGLFHFSTHSYGSMYFCSTAMISGVDIPPVILLYHCAISSALHYHLLLDLYLEVVAPDGFNHDAFSFWHDSLVAFLHYSPNIDDDTKFRLYSRSTDLTGYF